MKKKLTLLTICFLVLSLCAYAQDDGPLGMRNRKFEIGLFNFNFTFTNDFLSFQDIFQETIVLDIDNFSKGFEVNLGIGFIPVYFNVSMGEWGFGLSTGVEAIGIFDLSGKLLTFSNAIDDKSDVSGALFASAGINGFLNVGKFKVTVKPVMFYTIAYAKPNISYTFDPDSGNILKLAYDVQLYTAVPVDGMGGFTDGFSLTATPGFDFTFGVEYPLSKEFDAGLSLINIPIVPSVMSNYLRITGLIGSEEPLNLLDGDISSLLSSFNEFRVDPVPGTGSIEVERPFKLIAWVNWRVLGTRFLTLTPMIGFSINQFYAEEFSMEFGVSGHLNLINMLYISAGVNYKDRLWVNSVDLALNLRAFEFDIGADIRSQDFINSWTGGGFGLNIGFKFGW